MTPSSLPGMETSEVRAKRIELGFGKCLFQAWEDAIFFHANMIVEQAAQIDG